MRPIQAILRHSNVSVTHGYYIKPRHKAGMDAMKKSATHCRKLAKLPDFRAPSALAAQIMGSTF
jgi:hypothetical protein